MRRFGVATNPILDAFFFFLFVGMMHFGVESSYLNYLFQAAFKRYGTTLLAGILSTIDFESISHKGALFLGDGRPVSVTSDLRDTI